MNERKIFQDFAALPPEAQKLVADFVALLSKQTKRRKPVRPKKTVRLEDEEFIGIWKQRAEMQNSSAYVRQLRQQEWA